MVSQSGLITHLIELRSRLLKMLVSVLLIFVCLSPFAQTIYHLLAQPLLNALPEGASMIATDVASPFLAPFKLKLLDDLAHGVGHFLLGLHAVGHLLLEEGLVFGKRGGEGMRSDALGFWGKVIPPLTGREPSGSASAA